MPTKPCITFPAPPLKFRTASFPQYGFKAGLSDGAFPHQPTRAVCFRPSCSPRRPSTSVQSRSYPLGEAPPFKRYSSLYPRGPRSGAGYVVPHPHRLIGLIRPTCRHIESSPHCGLYPMPSLGVHRLGPQVVPCFRCMFLLDMPSSLSPESSSVILTQLLTDDTGLRLGKGTVRRSRYPHHPLPVGPVMSGLYWFAFATACQVASLLGGSDRVFPGPRDVYIRAFNESVTLHVAGYNYGGIWASSTDGTCTRWNCS